MVFLWRLLVDVFALSNSRYVWECCNSSTCIKQVVWFMCCKLRVLDLEYSEKIPVFVSNVLKIEKQLWWEPWAFWCVNYNLCSNSRRQHPKIATVVCIPGRFPVCVENRWLFDLENSWRWQWGPDELWVGSPNSHSPTSFGWMVSWLWKHVV